MRALLLAVLGVALALSVSAPLAGGQPSCAPNTANALQTVGAARQLITVEARTYRSTSALLRRWSRGGDGCWRPVGAPWAAWLGVNGVADSRREGDGTTPTGVYAIGRTMYGNAPNPGVRYRYRRISCGDWWVEDPASPAYNTFQHVPCGRRPPFRTKPPGMWQDPIAYRHLAVIEFNMRPVIPGRGSGIFLHASKGHPTAGCVSLPVGRLVSVLRWLDPAKAPRIAIGTRGTFRRL